MAVYPLGEHVPQIDPDTYIAPSALVAGQVTIAQGASVWFNVVMRADCGVPIIIGRGSNVQDNSVLHTDYVTPLSVGDMVTIGHAVVLHSCSVGDGCLIGIGAIILDNAVIGEHSVVGAHSLVPPGKVFPPYSLIMGNPAKVVRTLSPEEAQRYGATAERYIAKWKAYYKGHIE
ncbi:gamma carbonic anhydrase family protein [Heliophilum fasciatum]|uniref:Carbonic anhydrase/acetyltransferase-like protein (Isoleucine patch superfamily) n=1 Tax=Heliophilum fasciatum TaxID=35700 RepID=A0A4R2RMI6_9FIRM|nr:gamma carbonic anhydrase family protein [Heliophilum fasciatum]MCW2278155.1 carbonic anhydrase/acetyltransferase-like protein (isoleucine patch superfamily) [Heliophilum fasciatum]TCP64224.1 carbonic anhydrase/acetyltransferase-like protein (isoleucine patch superfamily) [Heliophilum fasciatum]